MNLQTTRKLNNGVEIPMLGLGVFQSPVGSETQNAVKWALEAGYRHIDTAAAYNNEADVGVGVRESGVPREEIFITTKLWNGNMREGNQLEAFNNSLDLLGMDYVDLYLIHWPVPGKFIESWKVLEEIYASGKAKAIGVSNFNAHHIDELMQTAKVTPAVNQIEYHPLLTQVGLIDYCEKAGIAPEAWSPLGGTGGNLLQNTTIGDIAKKYSKSPAQVIIRWDLQNGVITIPKSVHQNRIAQNTEVFDFALTDEDMAAINALNKDQRVGPDPDNFNF